jgi:hypothetical protein
VVTASVCGAAVAQVVDGEAVDGGAVAAPSMRELPEGHVLIDDIIVPERFLEDRATYQTNLWLNHVVPYVFDANVTPINRNRMVLAMAEIEAVANVTFIERTVEADYLHIQSSTGNNSFVGRIGGGQVVNIVSWTFRYVIVHELCHALGMWHEHQRSDRGEYVLINTANMQPGTSFAFAMVPSALVLGPYDFASVMHYDPCAFSVCCPAGSSCGCAGSECYTIEALPEYAEFQGVMGNRTELSDGDATWLAFAYGEVDCNGNGIRDYDDIASGVLADCNANGAPDVCEGVPVCVGDVTGDCTTNAADFVVLAAAFGSAVAPGTSGDLNGDGIVNAADFVILAAEFGAECP